MNSCVFMCRADGTFKHVGRRQWLQLVAGEMAAPAVPSGCVFLQCDIDKARVRFTRWQSASGGGLSQHSNGVRPLQKNHLTLAHLLAGKPLNVDVVDVEEPVPQVQASLQSYIGGLLDPCVAAKSPLHRVA